MEVILERTYSMIKPDATSKNVIGRILSRIEDAGFKICELRMTTLSQEKARQFYAIHQERSFFEELITFITSGSVVMMVLEKENAIVDLRKLVGATNSLEADPGTIRQVFGTDVQANAIHASDSPETAKIEIAFFENY